MTRHASASPLARLGWRETRAGRWIDPVTKRSFSTREAWEIVNARGRGIELTEARHA